METQSLINLVFTGFGALSGFILKAIWDGVKELQVADKQIVKDVSALQVLVAGKYVTWEGLKDVVAPIGAQLTRIEGKLDAKADKASCPSVVHQ